MFSDRKNSLFDLKINLNKNVWEEIGNDEDADCDHLN